MFSRTPPKHTDVLSKDRLFVLVSHMHALRSHSSFQVGLLFLTVSETRWVSVDAPPGQQQRCWW